MSAWLILNGWFFLSAAVYGLLVAKSFDGRSIPWFPLSLAREHPAVPVLKVIPTCTALALGSFALGHSQHWFVLAYLFFLVLMVVIDFAIVARPRQVMYLALAAHVLSAATVLRLSAALAPVEVLWFYGGTALLATLVIPRVMRAGIPPRYAPFVWGYAALVGTLVASFTGLAACRSDLPLTLRATLVGTGVFIAATDSLWALREFAGRGTRLGVSVTYNAAMWFLAMTIVGFAEWVGR